MRGKSRGRHLVPMAVRILAWPARKRIRARSLSAAGFRADEAQAVAGSFAFLLFFGAAWIFVAAWIFDAGWIFGVD
jgi:hypothetical protein